MDDDARFAPLQEAQERLNRLLAGGHTPVEGGQQAEGEGQEGRPGVPVELPIAAVYIDRDNNQLVIGLSAGEEANRSRHEEQIERLLGDVPRRLTYVTVVRDDAPNKKQACRPLWGGVRVQSGATLSVVYDLRDGTMGTILSGHGTGGVGTSVGQPGAPSPYGKVTINPPLTYRASDSALAVITNQRIQGQPNAIWIAPNQSITVSDYAISANTPLRLVIYMQGAQTDDLQRGFIYSKGVTVRDARGTLVNQVLGTYSAQGGDSGAPVFYLVNNYAVYVGIHAGRMQMDQGMMPFYSPWEAIRSELNLPQY